MTQSDQKISLREMLDICSNPRSPRHQWGWKLFLERYKMFIYHHVTKTSLQWNVPRLKLQTSDTVNDIVSEIWMLLCKNNCHALKQFQARDNEPMFLSWMATICRRAAGRYIQRQFHSNVSEGDMEVYTNYISTLDFERQWELYEHVVQCLKASGHKKRNIHRDLHLFLLNVWGDFSPEMIGQLPCYHDLGHRIVDNVTNRFRNHLKNSNAKINFN